MIDQKLLRIGIFYDGNYFYSVSMYYRYMHERKKHISIPGLHEFVKYHIAKEEEVDVRFAQIVDAHFFRGRLWARDADVRQTLYAERVLDDILMAEGVVTHYLPIASNKAEKGIDVWLALEAFELAAQKRFDILVLITGDSDFIPLVRKLNSLGTRVMVLAWNFKWLDKNNFERETTTSVQLLHEVTYPVMMHLEIDDKSRRDDPLINGIFFKPKQQSAQAVKIETAAPLDNEKWEGEILSVKDGYGFIKCSAFPGNVFYHYASLENRDFDDLFQGQRVMFGVEENEKGMIARNVYVLLSGEDER